MRRALLAVIRERLDAAALALGASRRAGTAPKGEHGAFDRFDFLPALTETLFEQPSFDAAIDDADRHALAGRSRIGEDAPRIKVGQSTLEVISHGQDRCGAPRCR